MSRIRTLVIVLAGGAGGRLEHLTRDRATPALPFARDASAQARSAAARVAEREPRLCA